MVRITINGKDAFGRYGILLSSGGFSALRKPAPSKPFVESKSRLQDGKRVVRKNPKVDERTLILPITLTARNEEDFINKYNLFCTEVLETGYVEIIADSQPNVVYRCIYDDCQQYSEFIQEMAKFMLKLTEPNPKNRSTTTIEK